MGTEDWDQDTFSPAVFPLPFRVLFLICLGILGWATNLHGLHTLGLDATNVLEIKAHDFARTTPRNAGFRFLSTSYSPVYRLFAACFIWCLTFWSIYRVVTYRNLLYVDVFKYLPAVAALGVLIGLVCPFDMLQPSYREALLV
jgi:hypothetical protein